MVEDDTNQTAIGFRGRHTDGARLGPMDPTSGW
jgi:hypothetical protein